MFSKKISYSPHWICFGPRPTASPSKLLDWNLELGRWGWAWFRTLTRQLLIDGWVFFLAVDYVYLVKLLIKNLTITLKVHLIIEPLMNSHYKWTTQHPGNCFPGARCPQSELWNWLWVIGSAQIEAGAIFYPFLWRSMWASLIASSTRSIAQFSFLQSRNILVAAIYLESSWTN